MTERLIIPTVLADVEIDEEHEVVTGAADAEMPMATRITIDGKPVKAINFKRNPQ